MRSVQALSFFLFAAPALVRAEAQGGPPNGFPGGNHVFTAHNTQWVTQTVRPGDVVSSTPAPTQTPTATFVQEQNVVASGPSSSSSNGLSSSSSIINVGGSSSSINNGGGSSSQNGGVTTASPAQGTGGAGDMSAKCSINGEGKGTSGAMTVTFINSYGSALSMSFGDGNGQPGAVGLSTSAVPLPTGQPYVATFDVGWAGRVAIGNGIDSRGSKFEGSIDPNFPYPSWDVSYVDGYTVPIVCSEDSLDNPPLRGCNIELWKQGNGITCDDVRNDNGKLCFNNANNEQGWTQPEDFFQACEASAYVFPKDDCATVARTSNTIVCCVGSNCPAAVSQSGGNSKRDLLRQEAAMMEMQKRGASSPSLMARRKHLQKHAAMGHHVKV